MWTKDPRVEVGQGGPKKDLEQRFDSAEMWCLWSDELGYSQEVFVVEEGKRGGK